MKPTRKATVAKPAPKKPATAKAAKPAPASKTPTREWVALVAAHAKAKPGDSDLPEYKIKALPEGTRLTAILAEDSEDHWRIKDGAIDGKALPRNIKILEKAEWRLLPLHDAPAAEIDAVAETSPGPAPTAETAPAEPERHAAARLKLCVRGAGLLAPHLKQHFNVVVEGASTFRNWGIYPVARAVAVHEQVTSPAGRALLEKLPGIPPGRFTSEINTGGSDVYVLSFASEIFPTLFRSKSTGMVLPLSGAFIGALSSAKTTYAAVAEKAAAAGVTEPVWDFLRKEFEFVGVTDATILADDLKTMFEMLRGKTVIVVMLNSTIGSGQRLLTLYEKINAVVRPMIEPYGLHAIEINDFVRGPDDLAADGNGGAFKAGIYKQIAARVTEIAGVHVAA